MEGSSGECASGVEGRWNTDVPNLYVKAAGFTIACLTPNPRHSYNMEFSCSLSRAARNSQLGLRNNGQEYKLRGGWGGGKASLITIIL